MVLHQFAVGDHRAIRSAPCAKDRAGMLKTPIDRDPPRPPTLHLQFFCARGVPRNIKHVKVLARENVPIAFEKCAPQMRWQRFQRFVIFGVVRVNRIIRNRCADKCVIVSSYLSGRSIPRGARRSIHSAFTQAWPMLPGLVAPAMLGTRPFTGHRLRLVRNCHWLQREVRQLIDADKEILRALILVHIVLVLAVAEARFRTVTPGDHVLAVVVVRVQIARHVAAKIREQ